jgi:hypothetical protein
MVASTVFDRQGPETTLPSTKVLEIAPVASPLHTAQSQGTRES